MGDLGLDCKGCNEAMKQDRGCVSDSPIPGRWEVSGYKMQRCPLAVVDYDALVYFKAHRFMRNGILPNSGGWLDQPSLLCESLDLIESLIRKKEAEHGRDKY